MGILDSMRMNPSLTWLSDMIQLTQADEIKVPTLYPQQVYETKNLLMSDGSGIVNTVLDFAINCSQVGYSVETPNQNLTSVLNKWLHTINFSLKGKIPLGIKALAKEYGRERWKGSSFLLLRTVWEEVDGYNLPTKLWFVDGEDIIVNEGSKDGVRRLGDEKYFLRVSKRKKGNAPKAIALPSKNDELIFIQKPYSSWNDLYPIPYVIQKGIFRNLKFLELLEKKGDFVVGKALEYLLLLKKGNPQLSGDNPDFTYSKEDIQKVKDDLTVFLNNRNNTSGVSAYTTGFDTEFEHLIPEYAKAIKQELYTPTERKLLAGLGLVDVIEGIASTRKESILNPKPFIADVESSISDFKTLLSDIMFTIIERNKNKHKKYFSDNITTKIHSTPIKQFINKDLRQMMRSIYDRGGLSKQTFIEVVGELDYNVELERREKEMKSGADIVLYPPVIQNVERDVSPQEQRRPIKNDKKSVIDEKQKNTDPEAENKTGLEKVNYVKALEETICPVCGEEFDFESAVEIEIGVAECPNCEAEVIAENITGRLLIEMDNIQSLAVGSNVDYQKGDYISVHLEEESYKQKITTQSYSYFKLALISKAVKDFQKENEWKCYDVLNIDHYSGKRTRPVYSKLPTSRVKTEELLVDGFYCLGRDDEKLVVGIKPYMTNFGVEVYSNNSSKDLADIFIEGFEAYASENNFLKREKITPQGKFLTIPETTFSDVKLKKDKKQAIKIGVLEFFKKKDIYEKNKLPFKRGLIFAGEPGCQPKGELVLMANKTWKNVEDIKLGDKVISPQKNGSTKEATVLQLKQYDSEIYTVKLGKNLNTSYRVAAEHLIVGEGRELKEYGTITAEDFYNDARNNKYRIKGVMTPAIEFSKKDFDIEPYHMGLILGDGYIANYVNITNIDNEVIEEIYQLANYTGTTVVKRGISYNLVKRGGQGLERNKLMKYLRGIGLLGKKSGTKFIPLSYLNSSINQRLELLAGLIDTDGSIQDKNNTDYGYTTISYRLAKDVYRLCRSLGFGVSINKKNTSWTYKGVKKYGEAYGLNISPQDYVIPVRLERKKAKLRNSNWKNIRHSRMELIKENKIERVYGFNLDSESELYVTNNWVLTHNTGKTLVGKSLMKEADNTFIWVTAGDLTNSWGDIDPQAFGSLLSMAKELAPSVLFAEDIDDYLEAKSSVDTIKTQMDGLDSMDGVVTVLCTNYPERIPKSLIDRPSRFDDVIIFDLPDEELRYDILDAHLKSVTIKNRTTILKKIAKNSDGLTGAHLKEVAVYSILLASDSDREEITKEDFDKALDKIKKTRELIQTLDENKGVVEVIYEEAPYTKTKYPKQIQSLPSGARTIWIDTFNSVLKDTEDENQARMAAWRNVKLQYKKKGNKWVKRVNS